MFDGGSACIDRETMRRRIRIDGECIECGKRLGDCCWSCIEQLPDGAVVEIVSEVPEPFVEGYIDEEQRIEHSHGCHILVHDGVVSQLLVQSGKALVVDVPACTGVGRSK